MQIDQPRENETIGPNRLDRRLNIDFESDRIDPIATDHDGSVHDNVRWRD